MRIDITFYDGSVDKDIYCDQFDQIYIDGKNWYSAVLSDQAFREAFGIIGVEVGRTMIWQTSLV